MFLHFKTICTLSKLCIFGCVLSTFEMQKVPPRNWISKRYPLAALLGTRGCPKEGSQRISCGLTNVHPRGNPKWSHDQFGHILVTGPGHAPVTAALAAGSGRRRGRFKWPPPWPLQMAAAVAASNGRRRGRFKWPPPWPQVQAAAVAARSGRRCGRLILAATVAA
jgi:hypothetical protein